MGETAKKKPDDLLNKISAKNQGAVAAEKAKEQQAKKREALANNGAAKDMKQAEREGKAAAEAEKVAEKAVKNKKALEKEQKAQDKKAGSCCKRGEGREEGS